jgi:hypothetical protein
MRKSDLLGWVITFVLGTIGGLIGTIFFAIWFIGCANETFASAAETFLPDSDSGRERMLVDGGSEVEADVGDASADTIARDSSKVDSALPDPPCLLDADVGDAAALVANGSGPNSCFQVTRDTGMGAGGYTSGSCSAPVDCPKIYPSKPLSYVCYGGDGGQLSPGCIFTGQGTANNWWYCCL